MFKISLSLKSPDRVQSTKDAIAEQRRAEEQGELGSWGELGLFTFNLFPSPDGDSNNNLY